MKETQAASCKPQENGQVGPSFAKATEDKRVGQLSFTPEVCREMYEQLEVMITSIELTMHSIETRVPCSAVASLAYEIVKARKILKKARGQE